MKRPVRSARLCVYPRAGYSLIEILMAAALAFVMIAAVVRIFGNVGESLNESRATIEMSDRLRAAKARMTMDLAGATATSAPSLRPESAQGYISYTEGPIGPILAPIDVAINKDDADNPIADTTVGDFDDILMFTIRSTGRPFAGLFWDLSQPAEPSSIESDVAEVAWFVRGRTLYRRMLLVVPGIADVLAQDPTKAFYATNDISVRRQSDGTLAANSLADLTRHQARFAHPYVDGYPSHPHFSANWDNNPPTISFSPWATVAPDGRLGLGLPTLRECCSYALNQWPTGTLPTISLTQPDKIDLWAQVPHPWPQAEVEPITGTLKYFLDPNVTRIAEDAILTNVIGFDVKAWDPDAPVVSNGSTALGPSDPGYAAIAAANPTPVSYGAFVDLDYSGSNDSTLPGFAGPGNPRSGTIRVFDTWSSHYEDDGIDQDRSGTIDQGTNGFDDNNDGVVDDPGEREVPPPYDIPLRAIQVRIRVYEPDSREIREVTIVQSFDQ